MRWIFGSQNQMGSIDESYLMKSEFTISRLFWNNQQRRSLDYVLRTHSHDFAAPEHLSAHANEAL